MEAKVRGSGDALAGNARSCRKGIGTGGCALACSAFTLQCWVLIFGVRPPGGDARNEEESADDEDGSCVHSVGKREEEVGGGTSPEANVRGGGRELPVEERASGSEENGGRRAETEAVG